MQEVLQKIVRMSRSLGPILITGETGTGKEAAARAIHKAGPRPHEPFVVLNCRTRVPSLIETELFGYERDAFRGAINAKTGLFETVKGGILYLEKIEGLPLDLQGKLLRVIQERQVWCVGDTRWTDFRGRLIASTNRDLPEAVRQGNFRKDLSLRLNVLTIQMPPLRHRKEDIPLLADHFLAKYCGGKRKRPELSPDALDCLMAYEWPGNVRELENCIRRARALESGQRVLRVEDLPENIRKPPEEARMRGLRSG